MAEGGEVPFGVALAQEHRQVGDQSGELPIPTVGTRAEGVADMQHDLFGGVFHHRTGAPGQQFGVVQRGGVDHQCTDPQDLGGGMQRTVDGAKVGQGVGFFMVRAMAAQAFGNALRRAVPAGGNADAALPKTGPIQVIAG